MFVVFLEVKSLDCFTNIDFRLDDREDMLLVFIEYQTQPYTPLSLVYFECLTLGGQ